MTANADQVQALKDKFGVVPVGVRTNNVGNVLDSKFAQEQPGYSGPYTSPNGLTYATFTRPDYGLMASQELTSGPNYYGKGLDTVGKIIDKYAPVDKNNSPEANSAYKSFVAKELGVDVNDKLSPEQVAQLAPAQMKFELGGNPYNSGPVTGPVADPTSLRGQPSTMVANNDLVNPSVYSSPLSLPAQPDVAAGRALDTAVALTPLGMPNTVAGLFGNSAGDLYANRANTPISPDQQFAGMQGGNSGKDVVAPAPLPVASAASVAAINAAKSKANVWKKDAVAWGFTQDQLKDPETSKLIKQIYDMGILPKQSA
jgi:hypothetical protein